MINYEINRLINFAMQQKLITEEDKIYSTNMILGTLNLNEFDPSEVNETLETPTPILENILDYAAEQNLIENTVTERDLFDTLIMNCVMPRPSEVISKFNELYKSSKEKATEYYYNLSTPRIILVAYILSSSPIRLCFIAKFISLFIS